ncbi:MAG TPA: DUF456 domain-containing protein [Usitatibacter sp.]|nr:DUF456 domain-containing protein [Usitatibacter sp.]
MTAHLLLDAAAAILVVAGLAGTLLPVVPGTLLVFAGLFLAAWADGFARVGMGGLAVIGFLAALSWGIDFAGAALGARRVGASPLALAGATLGAFAGLFFGIPGLILGPFLGAVAGELAARGSVLRAGKVGLAAWLGLVAAAIAKLALAFLMVAVFAAFWFLGSAAGVAGSIRT